jgi:UDP-N-acetylmuramoyl-tripeptide--D-alanyl-D-alanine ligase
MRWSLNAIAAATGGTLTVGPIVPSGAAAETSLLLAGVGIDSRRLVRGELFVAIRADRDGHDYLRDAVRAGAGGLLIHESWVATVQHEVPIVAVPDTSKALLALGMAARDRLAGPTIGITGSVGKTSTKDMTAAALATKLRTCASEKSFNNELGVPLTLANAPESTEVAVVEMGSRGRGHLAKLCAVARPTIGVVTSVAAAHTEAFGTLEEVAIAKAELVEALPTGGAAILNADDARVAAMSLRTRADVLMYSAATPAAAEADFVAEGVAMDDLLRPSFVVRSPWGSASVRLEARGSHQVGNALAALAVAHRCGVDLDAASAALAHATVSPWRMELGTTSTGAVIVNDAYNANPASMAAALNALSRLPAERKLAVLGPMAELGLESESDHRAVALLAARLGIEVIAIATDAYGIEPVAGIDEAIVRLGRLGSEDAVLVKASRVAGLERLAARLLAGDGG